MFPCTRRTGKKKFKYDFFMVANTSKNNYLNSRMTGNISLLIFLFSPFQFKKNVIFFGLLTLIPKNYHMIMGASMTLL